MGFSSSGFWHHLIAHLVGVFRRRSHICRRKCFLSGCAKLSGYIVRMVVFVINRRHCVRDCCGLDAINAFVIGKRRGADRSGGFGYGCIRFFTCLLVIRLGRAQNDGCVPRLSRVDPQPFSALFQNSPNFGIKFWRLCPKTPIFCGKIAKLLGHRFHHVERIFKSFQRA